MSDTTSKILIADDDVDIAKLLAMECSAEGYSTEECHDGLQALESIRKQPPHLAILDWNMPMMSGIDVCHRLRETGSQLPVLMITAKDEVDDMIKALDAGADDYVSKPFNMRELLARIRALIRRSQPQKDNKNNLRYEDIEMITSEHRCSFDGNNLQLTVREFDLLMAFLQHPKQVLSRAQLIERVWGDDYFGDESVVDTYVRYLRQKLEKDGRPRIIQTVRGVGFCLRKD